jgi:hypothetical protein
LAFLRVTPRLLNPLEATGVSGYKICTYIHTYINEETQEIAMSVVCRYISLLI